MPVTRRVAITAFAGRTAVKVDAVMAPAEPEVGLLAPYPLSLQVVDLDGVVVPISCSERLVLLRALCTAYYALENEGDQHG